MGHLASDCPHCRGHGGRMSKFTSQLFLRSFSPAEVKAAGSAVQLYEVTQPFSYESDKFGKTITVPAGFKTDFASIPRAAWGFLDPEDPIIAWTTIKLVLSFSLSC